MLRLWPKGRETHDIFRLPHDAGEEDLREKGLQRIDDHLDASVLLLALYREACQEWGFEPACRNRSRDRAAIETYLMEKGKDWTHSHFSKKGAIECHAFRIDNDGSNILARLQTKEAPEDFRARLFESIEGLNRTLDVAAFESGEVAQDILWEVPDRCWGEFGPLHRGHVLANVLADPVSLADLTQLAGTKMHETFRYMIRDTHGESSSAAPHVMLTFKSPREFLLKIQGYHYSAQMARGFITQPGVLRVDYVGGEQDKALHGYLHFDRVHETVRNVFVNKVGAGS